MKTSGVAAAAAVALASTTSAAVTQKCATSNVCYSLNIPDTTASSGNGDIFFQITAPTSYQWVALGQGSGMSGSNIFVIYTDSTGSNVTLSPRIGTGHVQPKYSNAAQVTLLDGTGVANGIMTANVKCSNCNSWNGGKMDFTSSSASWIYAYKSGSALSTNDQSASISQHSNMGSFSFDFSAAKGGNDVNPFTSSAAASTGAASGGSASGAGASTCRPRTTSGSRASTAGSSATAASSATAGSLDGTGSSGSSATASNPYPWPTDYASWQSARTAWGPGSHPTGAPPSKRTTGDDLPYCDETSSFSNSSNGANGSSGSSGSSTTGSSNNLIGGSFGEFGGGAFSRDMSILIAHGVLASLAFVILFPSGAIAIRVLSFPGLVWLHAGIQVFSWLIYIVAFGLGIYMATNMRLLNNAHPVIGIVLFILLCFQPILGILHHMMFKKYSRRTFWSYAHLWLGRIIIPLGIINGGLGLNLANNTTKGKIAYAIIAAIMFLAFVSASVYGEVKRARRQRNASPPPVYSERLANSGDSSPERMEYYGKTERT